MSLRIFTILTFIIGIGLFSYSLSLPYYKDQKGANNLLHNSYKIDKDEYYKLDLELRTSKITLMDLGAGIVIASGIILLFLLLTKTKTLSDFKNLKSLNKLSIFVSTNLVWLLLIPGTFWYYTFRAGRGDYPPFADSIGIPIYTQIPFFLCLIIPMNLFILLTTINTTLPTKLFIKADTYSRTVILWEMFFGFWLLLNLICFIEFLIDGDHISIIVNLFFTYILLNLRAGKIANTKNITDNFSAVS